MPNNKLKVGKSKIVFTSEHLGDDYFQFDTARTYFTYLFCFLLAVTCLVTLLVWAYSFSFDILAFSETPIFWLGSLSALFLFAFYKKRNESNSTIHSESLQTAHLSDNKRNKVDAIKYLSPQLKSVLRSSYKMAAKNNTRVDGLFIAYALVRNKNLSVLFTRLGVNTNELLQKLIHVRTMKEFTTIKDVSDLLPAAYKVGFELESTYIDVGEMLVVLVEHDTAVREVLLDVGIDGNMIRNVLAWQYYDNKLKTSAKLLHRKALVHPRHHLDRAMTAMETPLLNQIGRDMTEAAAKGYYLPAVQREVLTRQIFEIIDNHSSLVIVGEQGVGKRRLLELLAKQMVAGDVPRTLKDKRLVNVSIGQLISGANAAEISKRIERLFYEAVSAGNAVLVIEDVHGLSGIHAGESESIDIASVLADAIKRSRLLVVATAEPEEYRKFVTGSALGEILKKIEMPEPDTDTAIKIVETRAHVAEAKHQVYFTYGAIVRLVEVAERYVHDRFLPRKATEHLDRIALRVKEKRGEHVLVNTNDVNSYMEKQLHLPLQQSGNVESDLLLHLEDVLHQDIVGQENAVKAVAAALRRTRAGVGNESRPIAVFLFLGPTGVGKTALAKALAKHYFKDTKNMLRLDMSEYQGNEGVSKLLGRRGQASPLVTSLRDKPFQVVLLDEFEKADVEVRNLFLQVFDDARLTDGTGKTADFTNAIIIATSNAGAQIIQEAAQRGVQNEELDKIIIENVLNENFSPELINRFDDTVIFQPLTEENVNNITRLIMSEISDRLALKGIRLEVSDEAIGELAALGFDRRFGARPLRRAVQKNLEEPLAQILLRGNADRRDTIVVNTLNDIVVKPGKDL